MMNALAKQAGAPGFMTSPVTRVVTGVVSLAPGAQKSLSQAGVPGVFSICGETNPGPGGRWSRTDRIVNGEGEALGVVNVIHRPGPNGQGGWTQSLTFSPGGCGVTGRDIEWLVRVFERRAGYRDALRALSDASERLATTCEGAVRILGQRKPSQHGASGDWYQCDLVVSPDSGDVLGAIATRCRHSLGQSGPQEVVSVETVLADMETVMGGEEVGWLVQQAARPRWQPLPGTGAGLAVDGSGAGSADQASNEAAEPPPACRPGR